MSIVHIGYHKTATTFLQNVVFPTIKGVNYVDYQNCAEQFKDLYSSNTLWFNSRVKEQFKIQANGLYSLEELVGSMGTGTYNYEIAQRLKDVGFKKVILTIRRQDKMVESIYRQHIQIGGILKPYSFITEPNFFRWSYLDYYALIERYAQLFGTENIHLILQEELKENQEEVLERLRSFVGAISPIELQQTKKSKNVSLSFWSIKLLRIINHFTYNYYKKSNLLSNKITTRRFRSLFESLIDPYLFSKLLPSKNFYTDAFKKDVKKDFLTSNTALNKKYKLGLDKYGYLD